MPMSTARGTGERRREERHAVCAYLALFDEAGKEIELDPDPLDLCEGGLRLRLGAPLAPGERLRFRLCLPSGEVAGAGTVRWCQPLGLHHLLGLEIVSLDGLGRWRLRRHLGRYAPLARLCDEALMLTAVGVAAIALLDLLRWNP